MFLTLITYHEEYFIFPDLIRDWISMWERKDSKNWAIKEYAVLLIPTVRQCCLIVICLVSRIKLPYLI